MAESEEELKGLLMKVKEEGEKVGLKLNIQKMKIMESGPITSWQIDGEAMETVTDFIFLAYSFFYLEPVCCSMSSFNFLPDLHTGFSRGRSGGLVFPSLSEFSTVYCDPHSQRLWHSQ